MSSLSLRCLPLCLWLGLSAALAQAEPATPVFPAAQSIQDSIYPRLGQAGLDVLHYDVTLFVDQPGTLGLRGEVTLTLSSREALAVISLDYLGPQVLHLTWNGQPVPFRHDRQAEKLLVLPPSALLPGEQARLTVSFAGQTRARADPALDELKLGWQAVKSSLNQPGLNFTFSEPDGARTFLPVNDHPSDPATFTLHLTVPDGYSAVASGVQGSVQRVATGWQYVFTQAQPIPVYALGIVIGALECVKGTPVPVGLNGARAQRRDCFPRGTTAAIREEYQPTSRMLEVLSDWYGPYPFEVYGTAVVTPRLPALETATLSTIPVASSNGRVIVHELAHQWFGNSVVLGDWSDCWLNEGFASYAELLWAQAQARDPQEVAREMVGAWYERLQERPTRPLVATREEQLFDRSAYVRGALALHALRLTVGDAAFKDFLHAYVAHFSLTPVRTNAVLNFVREHLGEAAAAALSVWVESPSLPPAPGL